MILARGPVAETNGTLTVRGETPGGEIHAIDVPIEQAENPAIELLWVKGRIRKLQRAKSREFCQEAIALACARNVLCQGAAFIAWDEMEQVSLATREVYQPACERERGIAIGGAGPSSYACASIRPLASRPAAPPPSQGAAPAPGIHAPAPDLLRTGAAAWAARPGMFQPYMETVPVDRKQFAAVLGDDLLNEILGPGVSEISKRRLGELTALIDWSDADLGKNPRFQRFLIGVLLWSGKMSPSAMKGVPTALEKPFTRKLLSSIPQILKTDALGHAYDDLMRNKITGMDSLVVSAFLHFSQLPTGSVVPQIFDQRSVRGLRSLV